MIKKIEFEKPLSVSDYITVINQLLSNVSVRIIGETTEIKEAYSGHVYFSLKDEKTGHIINCALWKSIYQFCGLKLEDGMKVIVSGSADVYGQRGTLTFKVKSIEPVGEGALKKAYEELKEKLHKEGLFSEERKRKLPPYPKKIGVITSVRGAAVHDFTNNLKKFGFKVLICDSKVEGQEAGEDILRSLNTMKKKDIDILVIIRGGGSLQSLLAFDNETITREVSNFPVPVIAGIGHHQDVPLVALAADAHCSTPTAVANKISAPYQKAVEELNLNGRKIINLFSRRYRQKEETALSLLRSFNFHIKEKEQRLENTIKDIIIKKKISIERVKGIIDSNEKTISISNPENQLKAGYAVVRKDGNIVRGVDNLRENDKIETTFYKGKVKSIVNKICPKKT